MTLQLGGILALFAVVAISGSYAVATITAAGAMPASDAMRALALLYGSVIVLGLLSWAYALEQY